MYPLHLSSFPKWIADKTRSESEIKYFGTQWSDGKVIYLVGWIAETNEAFAVMAAGKAAFRKFLIIGRLISLDEMNAAIASATDRCNLHDLMVQLHVKNR